MYCFWWGAGTIFFLLYIGKWGDVENDIYWFGTGYLIVIYIVWFIWGGYIYSREVGRLLKFQGIGDGEM